MKINKISFKNTNIQKVISNQKTIQKGNNFNCLNRDLAPSYVYKQYALTFCGNEDKPENEIKEENNFNKEKIAEWVKEISKLPPEEKKDAVDNMLKGLFTHVIVQTMKEREQIKVPNGLSNIEGILFKSVAQLVDKKAYAVKNPKDVVIFSNSFVTLPIEQQIGIIPLSSPIYRNKEFLDLFQSLNIIENNEIGRIIKFAFENDTEKTQKKLFNKFTLSKDPIIEEEHCARYQRSLNDYVFVEENESGSSLTKIVMSYNSSMFGEEKPSIVYEFNEEGNLAKITKFDQQCEIAAELYIDNNNKSVTVIEPNNKPRHINFKDGEFIVQ